MAHLAAIADVALRLRLDNVDGATGEQIEALLGAASAMVRTYVPNIDARVTAGSAQTDLVAFVVSEMVARVIRNPNGASQTATGPFSEAHPGPFGLTLTDAELAMLRATPTTTAAPVGTVGMGVGLGGLPCNPQPFRSPIYPWEPGRDW